jgi:lipoate-protein ligase A
VEVHLNVYKGVITELDIFGDFFVNRDIEEVKQALIGLEHRQEVVLEKLKEIKSSEYFDTISEEELAVLFF